MFIPLSTDAPAYHWPLATVGLIAASVVGSMAFWGLDPEVARHYVLLYGEGLQPLQWVTSNFVHGNIFHLAGNMIYLWGFGLVIEGKVGWLAFLAIYLGVGGAECAIEQTLMRHADGGASLGASAVIFGLVAMGMVWAPRNDVHGVLLLGWRGFAFDLPIATFALIYIAWEGLWIVFSGLTFGTSMLHLLGAALGFALASVLVMAGLVDCEGWDLYTTGLSGRSRLATAERKEKKTRRKRSAAEPRGIEDRSAQALAGLRAAMAAHDAADALGYYQDLNRMPEGWRPLEGDLRKLIAVLQRGGQNAESIPVMEDYLARFPEKAAKVRLKLAQILVLEQRPQRLARARRPGRRRPAGRPAAPAPTPPPRGRTAPRRGRAGIGVDMSGVGQRSATHLLESGSLVARRSRKPNIPKGWQPLAPVRAAQPGAWNVPTALDPEECPRNKVAFRSAKVAHFCGAKGDTRGN